MEGLNQWRKEFGELGASVEAGVVVVNVAPANLIFIADVEIHGRRQGLVVGKVRRHHGQYTSRDGNPANDWASITTCTAACLRWRYRKCFQGIDVGRGNARDCKQGGVTSGGRGSQ